MDDTYAQLFLAVSVLGVIAPEFDIGVAGTLGVHRHEILRLHQHYGDDAAPLLVLQLLRVGVSGAGAGQLRGQISVNWRAEAYQADAAQVC